MADPCWGLVEYLGRDWPRQRLWQSLTADPGPGPCEVVDQDGRTEPAQWDATRGQLAYLADLSAGARRRLHVRRRYRETEWPVRERDFDFRVVAEPEREVPEHRWRRVSGSSGHG
jgi:hypothetical protein